MPTTKHDEDRDVSRKAPKLESPIYESIVFWFMIRLCSLVLIQFEIYWINESSMECLRDERITVDYLIFHKPIFVKDVIFLKAPSC